MYVVELTVGHLPFEVTQEGHPRHLQMRTDGAVPWIKENLINVGRRVMVPRSAWAIAWVDGDGHEPRPFQRPEERRRSRW